MLYKMEIKALEFKRILYNMFFSFLLDVLQFCNLFCVSLDDDNSDEL